LDASSVATVPVLALFNRVLRLGVVDSNDQDANIHSAGLDFEFLSTVDDEEWAAVTKATVPDSKEEVGDAFMEVMGKTGADCDCAVVDDSSNMRMEYSPDEYDDFKDDSDDPSSTDDSIESAFCNGRGGTLPLAQTWAVFKSIQTKVPSWHAARRMDCGEGSAEKEKAVLLGSFAAVVSILFVAAGRGQIAVIPQTEAYFGLVATAGERGGDSTLLSMFP
jgi:hypothetical protein